MALPEVGSEFYPTPSEVLNQILADLRFGYSVNGLVVNVKPDSEHFIRAKAIADRISIALANNQISSTDINPLTAVEDALEELAGVFGVTRRGASKASGQVIVSVTNGPVLIPAGFRATSGAGNEYEVQTATLIDNGEAIEVLSIGTGTDQNIPFKSPAPVLTWNSAAIGQLGQTAEVDIGGIDGGAAEDTDEQLRARLIDRLSNPQVGGNIAQVRLFAEEATAAVEKAFVYSAVQGPGSYDVAVTRVGGDRTLSTANLNLVTNNILANMPGHAQLNVTSVQAELVNVVIDIALPKPVNAGGAGGGYRDAVPYPSDTETGVNVFAEVTAVGSNTITVNSTSDDPPKAGDRFGIWNPLGGPDGDGAMVEFTILSVGGVSGAYVITIDTNQSGSLAFVVAGMFLSVGAERLVDYAEVMRAAIALLGPGEKTDNSAIVPRGRRQPVSGISFPQRLTAIQLCALTDPDNNFPEVANVIYRSRHADGSQFSGTGTFDNLEAPSLPPTTADAPRILVLQNLAFRAKVA